MPGVSHVVRKLTFGGNCVPLLFLKDASSFLISCHPANLLKRMFFNAKIATSKGSTCIKIACILEIFTTDDSR